MPCNPSSEIVNVPFSPCFSNALVAVSRRAITRTALSTRKSA
jgi:hypothetical protein